MERIPLKETTRSVIAVVGFLLLALGIYGLVVSSNAVSIFNICSVNPDNSYLCNIYANSAAMASYNVDKIFEFLSGTGIAVGFILCLGAFLTPLTSKYSVSNPPPS